jgi:putative protein-disulfide isomerase
MKPKVTFVTDPLCSWCWAMLPDMQKLRVDMGDWLDFDLMMAGLQVGGPQPPTPYQAKQLKDMWNHVADTTGQTFSGELPDDPRFTYHSEVACRAVEIIRHHLQQPPWDYFHAVQSAFYLEACNINDAAELTRLAEPFGIKPDVMKELLGAEDIIEATRANFERAKKLGANALPSILLDTGEGPKLVCGGWVTAEYLRPDLEARIEHAHGPAH